MRPLYKNGPTWCPYWQARWRGVYPPWDLTFTGALYCPANNFTMSSWPEIAKSMFFISSFYVTVYLAMYELFFIMSEWAKQATFHFDWILIFCSFKVFLLKNLPYFHKSNLSKKHFICLSKAKQSKAKQSKSKLIFSYLCLCVTF